jgi:hypothetical protein
MGMTTMKMSITEAMCQLATVITWWYMVLALALQHRTAL